MGKGMITIVSDDDERRLYLRLIARAVAKTDWVWLAYALMSNHIHHAMVGGEERLHDE